MWVLLLLLVMLLLFTFMFFLSVIVVMVLLPIHVLMCWMYNTIQYNTNFIYIVGNTKHGGDKIGDVGTGR